MEALGYNVEPSFDEKQAPEIKLKHLPSSLRYEFLGPNSMYFIVLNAKLSAPQIDSLCSVLLAE